MASFQSAIGILGGTFDPIHFGHLRMAIELHSQLKLDKIHLLPCYQPVHRQSPVATPEHRLAMVKQAIDNEPSLYADAREIERQGLSYSIDTLIDFREERPETPLCFILGIDAFLGFLSWERALSIFDYAHLIIAHRPSYELPTEGPIADLLAKRLQTDPHFIHNQLSGGIMLCPITLLDIAASDIRKQVAMGANPRYLLPDAVYDYIQTHRIYPLTSE